MFFSCNEYDIKYQYFDNFKLKVFGKHNCPKYAKDVSSIYLVDREISYSRNQNYEMSFFYNSL